jgi:hypothetical protein
MRTSKSTFTVRDPQGVYEDQTIEVPFDLPVSAMKPQSIGAAKATIVRVLAIEAMYGCPLSDVDPAHVRDMLRSIQIYPEGADLPQ